ncbi:hypothetical protein B0H13DRAFT_2267818 [Mycena leptocephala]|nr:hypothetical protein B0H13DRAFT_2267818 [Mycena leptocephala]
MRTETISSETAGMGSHEPGRRVIPRSRQVEAILRHQRPRGPKAGLSPNLIGEADRRSRVQSTLRIHVTRGLRFSYPNAGSVTDPVGRRLVRIKFKLMSESTERTICWAAASKGGNHLRKTRSMKPAICRGRMRFGRVIHDRIGMKKKLGRPCAARFVSAKAVFINLAESTQSCGDVRAGASQKIVKSGKVEVVDKPVTVTMMPNCDRQLLFQVKRFFWRERERKSRYASGLTKLQEARDIVMRHLNKILK